MSDCDCALIVIKRKVCRRALYGNVQYIYIFSLSLLSLLSPLSLLSLLSVICCCLLHCSSFTWTWVHYYQLKLTRSHTHIHIHINTHTHIHIRIFMLPPLLTPQNKMPLLLVRVCSFISYIILSFIISHCESRVVCSVVCGVDVMLYSMNNTSYLYTYVYVYIYKSFMFVRISRNTQHSNQHPI